MVVELGHYALILAMLLAAAQAVFGLAGPALSRERWMAAAPSAACGQFVFTALAVGVLIHAFITNDFSVRYVADNSNSALPLFYRVTAMWGAHEGSILLWIFVLSVWTMAVVARLRYLPTEFGARVLGVLGVLSFGFLLFTLATSSPFSRLFPTPADGASLNPLLQDPAFAVHPPVLYTGYVGFSVSFAFACAAMIEGRRDQLWARWMRPWTVMAWAFLACGIALGSWWAYYELGWGGYWSWDPVENVSFMPWLVGTALLHSLIVTEKRGLFKSWTLLLALAAFSLSLLGTFIVRAGLLISVHSFAADPTRGIFILGFLVVVVGGALVLYTLRAPRMQSTAGFDLISRESFLLFNNILLVIAAAVVLAGTLAPDIAGALHLGTLSVGPPYFAPSFMVPVLPLLALLSVGIHARWKRGGLSHAKRVILTTLVCALVIGLPLSLAVYGHPIPLAPIGGVLGAWIVLSSLVDPIDRIRRRLTLSASLVGMTVAHIGLGVFVLGITFVSSNSIERDVAMKPGQVAMVGDYAFRYEGVRDVAGPNFTAVRGTVTVTHDGQLVTVLHPEKRRFYVQDAEQTTAAIAPALHRDLLASLGDNVGGGAWSLRLQYRPLIRFVWIGGVIMALGGMLAVFGRRQRGPATVPDAVPLAMARRTPA
ncbi:MAG TPA: heme lyase CcmF/NrfE family subunit [Steroidobacteraceae bacterium]|jgi:cytochrome c-type biogenesis protein CcmF|nr:heme lyase CcmF/NrfE family subunit [Steroidobacteraceae bacterium]